MKLLSFADNEKHLEMHKELGKIYATKLEILEMPYIYLHYYIIPTSFAYFWHAINVFYSVAMGTKFLYLSGLYFVLKYIYIYSLY